MNYDAEWMLVPHRHCPNLVSIPKDWDTPIRKRPSNDTMQTYKVTVHHTHQKSPQQRDSIADDEYDSLADMWSEYYNGYYHADFPRLIIRFEDMLFHRDYVMSQIAKCISSPEESSLLHDRTHSSIYSSAIHAPSSHARQWKYRIRNVKDHDEGHSSSSFRLVSAVIQYGTSRGRYAGMADEDLRYAAKALDATLMKKLHYKAGPTV